MILFLVLTAGPVQAQDQSGPAVSPAEEANEQADLLLASALEHDESGTWLMAALAYESSGNLRPDHDPRRIDEFASAGRAYQAGGYDQEAVGMWVQAGRTAEEQGESLRAAESLRNAAFLSAELGKSRRASDYALQACAILESGDLSSSDRRDALGRMGCPR